MSDETQHALRGIHIGAVGRDATFKADGDLAIGDMTKFISHASVNTTIYGFRTDADKGQFIAAVREVEALLRQIAAGVLTLAPPEGDADELATEVTAAVASVKKSGAAAAAVKPGPMQTVPPEAGEVTKGLREATSLVDKIKGLVERATAVGGKALEFSQKVGPLVAQVLPILSKARGLLGL
jgi:hypothetical protein